MVQRTKYDLTHTAAQCGKIGRLMTLSVIPVVAGDSIEIDAVHVMQLTPFRRPISVDPQVDIHCFFIPHRHHYTNWVTYLRNGVQENVVLQSRATNRSVECIPWMIDAARQYPAWLTDGYFQIWDRYYRPANMGVAPIATLPATMAAFDAAYGLRCANLDSPYTSGVSTVPAGTVRQVPTPGDLLDVVQLDQVRARYAADVGEVYFGRYYDDILKSRFGGGASVEADKRPYWLGSKTEYLGGTNIFATDTSSLGSSAGKAAGVITQRVPRRFFPEHGAIWTMALVRFPVIHEKQVHFLSTKADPSYLELAGDPVHLASQPPRMFTVGEHFQGSSAVNGFYQPYGNWYRTQPNIVHRRYDLINGYPFLDKVPTTASEMSLVVSEDYDNIFSTNQVGHWQSQSRFVVDADRVIPDAFDSIFTGGKS